jgi:hypothetical protein
VSLDGRLIDIASIRMAEALLKKRPQWAPQVDALDIGQRSHSPAVGPVQNILPWSYGARKPRHG